LPTAPVPATNAEGVSASSVRIVDNRFEPSALSVPVGTTVTWSNTGLNRHTATAMDGSFDTGDMPSGASNRLTFDQPGTYRYYCRQHILGGMLGVIQVTTASP
jgi:plastocyanin